MQCANIIWWHCNMSHAYNGIITISTFQHKTHTMRHTSLYQILNGIGMCWLLDEWIFNISFHLCVFLCLCIVPSVFVLIPVRMDLVTCFFLPVSPALTAAFCAIYSFIINILRSFWSGSHVRCVCKKRE